MVRCLIKTRAILSGYNSYSFYNESYVWVEPMKAVPYVRVYNNNYTIFSKVAYVKHNLSLDQGGVGWL